MQYMESVFAYVMSKETLDPSEGIALYDQKNGYTRNEYLDKITCELCEYS